MPDLSHIIPDLRALAVPLDDLKLDPANARTGHALDKIAASLHRYGQRKPIVVNRSEGNKIEAGNGTWQAAKALGWSHIAAVFVEDDNMTAVGYSLADNRLATLSEWDAETLQALVAGLDPEMNLPTGFDDGELEAMLAELGAGLGDEGGAGEPADAEPQTSRAEELRQKWQVEPGQMWRLPSRTPGQEHRLICGDCTDTAVVERVMGGEKAIGCFTSPPYAEQRKSTYGGIPVDEYVDWWDGVQAAVRGVLVSNGSFFVNIKPHREDRSRSLYVFELVIGMVRRYGWRFVDELCWKRRGVPGGWDEIFKNEFEPVYHFAGDVVIKFNKYNVAHKSDLAFSISNRKKDGRQSVFDCNADNGKEYHSGLALPGNVIEAMGATISDHNAAFPVQLPEFFIKAYSDEGDVWLEPFCGSGSMVIAAENSNRQARAIETSPGYCGVILQRYADAFNITPELITEETAVT